MQNWAHTRHWKNKVRKHRKGKLRMDNPETLATLGTQDKQTLEKTEGTIKNGQSKDIGNIEHTRHSRDTR